MHPLLGRGGVLEPSPYGYADPALNDEAQRLPIEALVDRLQYPTLGCPALLPVGWVLRVAVSLPEGVHHKSTYLSLVDRHRGGGERLLFPEWWSEVYHHGPAGRHGRRFTWQLHVRLFDVPPGLYDLALTSQVGRETQPNAVRIYERIHGRERVCLCSDLRFHREDAERVRRFVDRMNARDDLAWIALLGDVCQNGPRSGHETLRRAAAAQPGPVTTRYTHEYPAVARELARLTTPIFILPGDCDGMAEYDGHAAGTPTEVEHGPDPANNVAYDGLHYFQRTFGPLYWGFDWHRTRYVGFNSYALPRHHRIASHGVARNRGGWFGSPQVSRLSCVEVGDSNARDMSLVCLLHHDPRGAVYKDRFGRYEALRPSVRERLVQDALADLMSHAPGPPGRRPRQVFMRPADQPLDQHPMRQLLTELMYSRRCMVFAGNSGEFSADVYPYGEDIMRPRRREAGEPARKWGLFEPLFRRSPAPRVGVVEPDDVQNMSPETAASGTGGPYRSAARTEPSLGPALIAGLTERLADGDLAGALAAVDGRPSEQAREAIALAVTRLAERSPDRALYSTDARRWKFFSNGSVRFVHLDRLGLDELRGSGEDDCGYEIADLRDGRPVSLQRVRLETGAVRDTVILDPDV